MTDFRRAGSIAAFIQAACFAAGIGFYAALLAPAGFGGGDVARDLALIAERHAFMHVWNLIIYVVFGIFLVVLALALHNRLSAGAPVLSQVATAFGLIWATLVIGSGMLANTGMDAVLRIYESNPAEAATVYTAVTAVEYGLGGGDEVAGGMWVLLLSVAALRSKQLPKGLAYFGLVIGGAAVVTVVPALDAVAFVFGLGLIAWYVWVAVVLLRGSSGCAARSTVPTRSPGAAPAR